jgi:hypothetical protein
VTEYNEETGVGKPRTVPLARGLVGGEVSPIYGQLEVSLTNYKKLTITIRRKPYCGRRDVKFSILHTDLQDIIDILEEARQELDEQWLARAATGEVEVKSS